MHSTVRSSFTVTFNLALYALIVRKQKVSRVSYLHDDILTFARLSSGTFSTSNEFNVHGSVHCKNILIYIQQDATLHSLFISALHVSGGTTTHQQKRKQLYLQHLVIVRPLLLPAAIAAGSSNGLTNTRCCRYSCMCS
jgi:hypothetical protein